MIELAKGAGADVVMVAVPKPGLLLSPAPLYERVATATGVPIHIDSLVDILQYPANKSDAVHPNSTGYRQMAEDILALLEDNGAL